MAVIHPAIAHMPHPGSAGEYAERALINLLATAFSDNYLLFHHVDWSRQGHHNQAWLGELDAVMVNGEGDMVVIELKTGQLQIAEGRLYKDYRHQRKDVVSQFSHQRTAMRARLHDAHLNDVQPLHLLVLPDFQIRNPSELVSLNAEELVDANEYPMLLDRIRRHLPERVLSTRGQAVRRFLMNWLDLVPDVNAQKDRLGAVTRQLSDGLATRVPRVTSPSGLYLINATAGSGKTQMSLDILNKASARGQKTIYLCFNRPLADRMRQYVSPKVTVTNYDDMCVEYYRRHVGEPDFNASGFFDAAKVAFQASGYDARTAFDIILIDEAQDFEPAWVEHLLTARLAESGSAYVLQDADQRIYKRPAFQLPDAVTICCDDNFRTPQNIVNFIKLLKLTERQIRARSALLEGELEWCAYTDQRSLLKQTGAMLDHFLKAGYKPEDIVIATGRGKENSVVMKAETAGSHALRRPTSLYDENHEPVWTAGTFTTDTIYRTKGQSAPVVILTELDFETIDDKAARLLFVGLTRASMGVGLVLSARAHTALARRIDEAAPVAGGY